MGDGMGWELLNVELCRGFQVQLEIMSPRTVVVRVGSETLSSNFLKTMVV